MPHRTTGLIFIIFGISSIDRSRLLVALALLFNQAAFADFQLDRLMQDFSQTSVVQARFEEEKKLAVLESPLQLSGTLIYHKPDYLKKQVNQPRYSLLEIKGDQMRIADSVKERKISLDRHPAIRAFAEAYRATLAGDRATLEHYFDVYTSGTYTNWQLLLLPKTDSVRKFVQHIKLSGTGANISAIETLTPPGDLSIMTIFCDAQ